MIDVTQPAGEHETPLYSNVRVEDAFGVAGLGMSNRVLRVFFTPAGMQETFIDVPLAQASREHVEQLILEHLQVLHDITTLRGPAV